MMNSIAMWGGVAGLIVSIFAIIILYLTRKNILDILDKDAILFDNNFEIKKNAIANALSMVDNLNEKGAILRNDPNFVANAKRCYNDLLCVLSHMEIADVFMHIILNADFETLETRIASFKIMCRYDIGLKTPKPKKEKSQNEHKETANNTTFGPNAFSQPSTSQFNLQSTQSVAQNVPANQNMPMNQNVPTNQTAPSQTAPRYQNNAQINQNTPHQNVPRQTAPMNQNIQAPRTVGAVKQPTETQPIRKVSRPPQNN